MQFKVLSYNIHKGMSVANQRYVLPNIEKSLSKIDPDIVVLQEIVDSHNKHAKRFADWHELPQFRFLAENGWPHYAFGENVKHEHGSHGNAILSRYELKEWRNLDISRNRFEKRGLLHVSLAPAKLTNGLHIFSIHLNLLQRDRKHQLEHLSQHIQDTVPSDAPLIIAGDFNDWRNKACEILLDRLNVHEAHQNIHGRLARTFPAWRPILNLDRIYYRNLEVLSAETLLDQPWPGLSDHLPITADFKLS